MNASQRKSHGLIWLIIVLIMPIILFLSVRNLNFSSNEASSVLKSINDVPNPIAVTENNLIKLSMFEDSLEIILKKTLKNPSTLVYEIDANGKKGMLLGQLTKSGHYIFNTVNKPKGVMLYDTIKQSEISQLLF